MGTGRPQRRLSNNVSLNSAKPQNSCRRRPNKNPASWRLKFG